MLAQRKLLYYYCFTKRSLFFQYQTGSATVNNTYVTTFSHFTVGVIADIRPNIGALLMSQVSITISARFHLVLTGYRHIKQDRGHLILGLNRR